MPQNTLYYGDNLDVLRRYIADESVDLVYLDPPFKSMQDYNVLFEERDGTRAAAQIMAFEDTWRWDQAAAESYQEVVEAGGSVSRAMQAFRMFLGETDMLAYLSMMAPRLKELRRTLKPTGSIYLHCDPTASHYLKLLMDGVFGPHHFQSEIVWRRTLSKSLMSKRLPQNHDVILGYHRDPERAYWNGEAMFRPYDLDDLPEKTASKYRYTDEEGRLYRLDNLINPNPDRPNLTYEFMGVERVWRWTRERMEAALQEGLIVQTAPGRVPQLKRYLDEQRGLPLGSVWDDIPPLNSQAQERLGYPTQKPEALLERIISLASQPGDVVLDPFCGCGTAVAAAHKLDRRWAGIDITHLAINLIKHRMDDAFGEEIEETYEVIGEPVSVSGAEELAAADPYQFQWWALGLVKARPAEQKKGADKGIDGRLYFHDDRAGTTRQIIFSVKAGKTGRAHVHELRGVLEREAGAGAVIGVLISMQQPTRPMREEAASAGFYDSPFGTRHPRLQLLTVEELLNGARVDMPPSRAEQTFKRAPKAKSREQQPELDLG